MKKLKLAALTVACIMIFSGCSLVSPDEERIANQVVATVNGAEIYRYEVEDVAQMYAMYYGIDPGSQDEVVQAQYVEISNSVLDDLVTQKLMLLKADELGITLTEEEKQANKEQTDEIYDNRKTQIRTEVEEEAIADTSIDVEDEVEKRYAEYVESMGSRESYCEEMNETSIIEKVRNYIYSLAELSDEEVKEWYDMTLEMQKDEMAESAEAFEGYVTNRNIYTYIPEDTIAVKQVLLKFTDEELTTEAKSLYTEGKVDEAMALLQPEIDKLMPEALAAKGRLEDGEDLDEVIADVGEDELMQQGATSEFGYLVGQSTSHYLPEFCEAALRLNNVGDVSEPVATYYGLHVMQNIKIYEAGEIPFEDLEENIKSSLLTIKEQEMYTKTQTKWEEAADIVYYRERLQ